MAPPAPSQPQPLPSPLHSPHRSSGRGSSAPAEQTPQGAGTRREEEIFKRYQRQGEVPVSDSSRRRPKGDPSDARAEMIRLFNLGNYDASKIQAKAFDRDGGRQARFEALWQRYCFV